MNVEYNCDLCENKYKTKNGLSRHKLNFHKVEINDDLQKQFICDICGKKYNNKFSKYKHKLKCKEKEKINNVELEKIKTEFYQQIQELKNKIDENNKKPIKYIKKINKINNGIVNINNGPIYNFIKKPGKENVNILTEKEIEYIMDQEMNCIIGFIEILNFNEKYPENHSFCTTALNDKYISAINTETLMIEKYRKRDFYDNILYNGLNNLKLLYKKLKLNKSKKYIKYKETIDKISEFLIMNNKGKKTYVELINSLTFNKRHITQSTWFQLQQGITPNNIPKITNKSSTESTDESSTESTDESSTESTDESSTELTKKLNVKSSDESSDESINYKIIPNFKKKKKNFIV